MRKPHAVISGEFAKVGEAPLVSVIATTYTLDRLNDVKDLLKSLKKQTYHNIEIIFIAEGTTELSETVRAYGKEHQILNLQVIVNNGQPGLPAARNLGVIHSTGQIVAFIDDDATAYPNWIEAIVGTFMEHPGAIGATGPAFPKWEDTSMQWLPEEFYWIVSCPTARWTGYGDSQPIRNAWGMNMAFRRDAFKYADFLADRRHLDLSRPTDRDGTKVGVEGDDTEFSLQVRSRSGKAILYIDSMRVSHKVPRSRLSPRFIRNKSYWQGYTKPILAKIHGDFNMDLEHHLLGIIVRRYLPRVIKDLLVQPSRGCKELWLGCFSIFYFGLGYLSSSYPIVGRLIAKRFGR